MITVLTLLAHAFFALLIISLGLSETGHYSHPLATFLIIVLLWGGCISFLQWVKRCLQRKGT